MSAHNGAHLPPGSFRPSDSSRDELPVCPWQESLAAHALGALARHELPGVLEHLAGGCGACNAEHGELLDTLAIMDEAEAREGFGIAAGAPSGAGPGIPGPGPTIKARLLEALAKTPQDAAARSSAAGDSASTVGHPAVRPGAPAREFHRPWRLAEAKSPSSHESADGLTTVPGAGSENDGFERTGIEGIETKTLFVDPTRRRVSMMVRMAPGTSYPAHRHAALEECFVVAGELHVGERLLRAGDYQVAAQHSIHEVQSTERGCLLFIVSSQDDELV